MIGFARLHVVPLHRPACGVGCTVSHFFDSAGTFFSQLADLQMIPLLVALVFYGLYLLLRSRALWAALRAAYPNPRVRWRDVWGAYMVGYAINNVLPFSGGNIAQLFLTRTAIPGSSYPTVAAALSTGLVFDYLAGVFIMCVAFLLGFPSPTSFAHLPAFDISFFAANIRFTLFLLTVLGVLFMVAFALLSARVVAFWRRVRQGFTILASRRRWRREMARWQAASWVARFVSYWALLDAFHIGGSVRNTFLVLGVQVVASVFPFTPGGAGVQQAILVTIFSHTRYIAAFSVGQQIATIFVSSVLGFAALVLVFRLRSFREVIRRAKEHRAAEAAMDHPLTESGAETAGV
jgi:uncharacterized membrane protein YbhN (UPF0104 family)